MSRVKWLIDAAIDYGSIVLVALVALLFLGAAIERQIMPQELPPEMTGITTIFGVLLVALAVKLWRDVREERRHQR